MAEVSLCMAYSNAVGRARRGEIRRPPEWLERREKIVAALWAALETLVALKEGKPPPCS